MLLYHSRVQLQSSSECGAETVVFTTWTYLGILKCYVPIVVSTSLLVTNRNLMSLWINFIHNIVWCHENRFYPSSTWVTDFNHSRTVWQSMPKLSHFDQVTSIPDRPLPCPSKWYRLTIYVAGTHGAIEVTVFWVGLRSLLASLIQYTVCLMVNSGFCAVNCHISESCRAGQCLSIGSRMFWSLKKAACALYTNDWNLNHLCFVSGDWG